MAYALGESCSPCGDLTVWASSIEYPEWSGSRVHLYEDWFLPLPRNLVERLIIPARDDIACQDHDISVPCRRQHPARAKFKMQVAISNDSHARKRTLV